MAVGSKGAYTCSNCGCVTSWNSGSLNRCWLCTRDGQCTNHPPGLTTKERDGLNEALGTLTSSQPYPAVGDFIYVVSTLHEALRGVLKQPITLPCNEVSGRVQLSTDDPEHYLIFGWCRTLDGAPRVEYAYLS